MLSRRVFAFLVDYLFIGLLWIPAAVVVFFLGILTLGLGWLLYPILFFVVAALYFGMSVAGPSQATPGMRMMGIAMIRLDGRKIDFVTAIAHLALFWILNSVLTPLVLLAAYSSSARASFTTCCSAPPRCAPTDRPVSL